MTSPASLSLVPVVISEGRPVVNSRDVAAAFGKRHTEVMRTIHLLLSQVPDEFNRRNFASISFLDVRNRPQPCFNLTRDAFALVAMGFTGKRATVWKVKYIEAFNAMEAELRAQAAKPAAHAVPAASYLPVLEERLRMLLRNNIGQQEDCLQALEREQGLPGRSPIMERLNILSENNQTIMDALACAQSLRQGAIPA